MKQSHIAIEILPRALWLIQGIILYLFCKDITLTTNVCLLYLGMFLLFNSTTILFWTFKSVTRAMFDKSLITTGPYQFIRHPMYVGIYLALVAIGCMNASLTWFIILLVFMPLWYIDCRLEEKQMIELHGEKYSHYRNNVGMFFPRYIKINKSKKQ